MSGIKLNESQVKTVVHKINSLAKAHGFEITKRAVARWATNTRLKKSLEKKKRALEKELELIHKKLK